MSAIFLGDKTWENSDTHTNHNNYKVTVKNIETGKSIKFDFWASIAQPKMEGEDLRHCLYCFISDTEAGQRGFDDFCNEFGYDTGSRKAHKIWKACKKQGEKLEKVFDGDIYGLLNDLNE